MTDNTTPEEVEAMQAEFACAERGVACIASKVAGLEGTVVTLRARVTELETALRCADQFITNGVELGYIRMPEPTPPVTVHHTPGVVRAALEGKS